MPHTILVVEDDAKNREMITTVLRSEGYTVMCAEDGKIGLALAESRCPHLILTDLNMPNLDGIAMIRTLRAQPELKNVPIIACTAHASGIATSEAINAGANHAACKPIGLSELLSLITRLLSETVIIGLFIRFADLF